MTITTSEYLISPGSHIHLKDLPTRIKPLYNSHDDYQNHLAQQVQELSTQQELLYASNSYALLLIFQAMDAAGKDGAIKHVMSGVNPQGCQVHSYKHPSAEELQHDFLWRTTRDLPQRGQIGIFNRSYYEEVLIARVHPEILKQEGVPGAETLDADTWAHRYQSINGLEQHLHRNGTRILKFFLHLSKDEQKKRFLDRIDRPEKNWKISAADINERQYWSKYTKAYEDCINATSTANAPWHVIPADDQQTSRLLIAHIVTQALAGLQLRLPSVDAAKKLELERMRSTLIGD